MKSFPEEQAKEEIKKLIKMRYYYYTGHDHLSMKILAWFLSCLLIGAFLAMMLEEPGKDETLYRRNNRTVPIRRRIEKDEEEIEFELTK